MSQLNLNLEETCNQDCFYCQRRKLSQRKPLVLEEVYALLEADLHKDTVCFMGGGEPTMNEGLPYMIAKAKSLGYKKVLLETNAVKLSDRQYARRLKDSGLDGCVVSLHSHLPHVSDRITQTKGSFVDTLQGIWNIEQVGIAIDSMLITINALNMKQLKGYIDFLSSQFKTVKKISIGFVRPLVNDEGCKSMTPRLSEVELAVSEAIAYAESKGYEVEISAGCDMPLCFLSGNEHKSSYVKSIARLRAESLCAFTNTHIDSKTDESHQNERIKVQACQSCFLNRICPGFFSSYTELYGDREASPVFVRPEIVLEKAFWTKPQVIISACPDYDVALIKEKIISMADMMGGFGKILNKESRVLIKPNLLSQSGPEVPANTHPLFVRAVVEILGEYSDNVYVGDCSGSNEADATSNAFERTGLSRVLAGTKAKFVDMTNSGFKKERIYPYEVINEVGYSEPMLHMDLIINLPKLKTHGITFMTGAVKNFFGVINPLDRTKIHASYPLRSDFSGALVDICQGVVARKMTMYIMDAIIAMEGDQGPAHGTPNKVGVILFSLDPYAMDVVASDIIGYKPNAIPTLAVAERMGLSKNSISDIVLLGDNIANLRLENFKKSSLFPNINRHKQQPGYGTEFGLDPCVINEGCIRCGSCVRACPVGAINYGKDGYPLIDLAKCIRCYCCHESCPKNSIELVRQKILGNCGVTDSDSNIIQDLETKFDGNPTYDGHKEIISKDTSVIDENTYKDDEELLMETDRRTREVLAAAKFANTIRLDNPCKRSCIYCFLKQQGPKLPSAEFHEGEMPVDLFKRAMDKLDFSKTIHFSTGDIFDMPNSYHLLELLGKRQLNQPEGMRGKMILASTFAEFYLSKAVILDLIEAEIQMSLITFDDGVKKWLFGGCWREGQNEVIKNLIQSGKIDKVSVWYLGDMDLLKRDLDTLWDLLPSDKSMSIHLNYPCATEYSSEDMKMLAHKAVSGYKDAVSLFLDYGRKNRKNVYQDFLLRDMSYRPLPDGPLSDYQQKLMRNFEARVMEAIRVLKANRQDMDKVCFLTAESCYHYGREMFPDIHWIKVSHDYFGGDICNSGLLTFHDVEKALLSWPEMEVCVASKDMVLEGDGVYDLMRVSKDDFMRRTGKKIVFY